MKKSILLILFILFISSYASAQTNLVTNPSFETGDLTGWNINAPTSWHIANGIDYNIYITLPYEDVLNFANSEEAFYLFNDLNYFEEFYVSNLTFSCSYDNAKFQKIKNKLFVYCADHIEFFDEWGGSGYLDGSLFTQSTIHINDYVDNNIIVISDYNIFNVNLSNPEIENTNIYTVGEASPLDALAGGFYFNNTLYVLEYGMNYPNGKFIAEYDNGVLTPVCDLGVGNFPGGVNQFFVEGDGGVFLISDMVANPVFFDGTDCEIITDYNYPQTMDRLIVNNSTVYYGGKFFTVNYLGGITSYDADTNTVQDYDGEFPYYSLTPPYYGRLFIFDDELYYITIEPLERAIFKFDSINETFVNFATHNLDTAINSFEYAGNIYGYGGSDWSLFYDSSETTIFSLAVFDNKLYAGSSPSGKVFVYDGSSWSESYDSTEYNIHSLAVFDNKLYAGTNPGGKIFVFDGSSWSQSYDSTEEQINSLAVFDNKLYAGGSGGVVFVYDGSSWSVSYDSSEDYINSLAVFDNKLYAGTYPGGKVLVFDGSSWSESSVSSETTIFSLAVFEDKLYAGTGANGKIFVYDGSSWSVSYDSSEDYINSLAVFEDKLYAGTSDGGKVFVYDGSTWSESYDSAGTIVWALMEYEDKLYAGTNTGNIYGYSGGGVYQSRVDNPYIDEKISYFYNIDGNYFLSGSIKSENENDYQLIYLQTIAPILEPGKEYEVKLNTGSIPPYAFNLSYGENFEDWEENKVSILTMPMAESTISITNDSEEAQKLVIYINDIAYPNRSYYSIDNIRVYEVEVEQPSNSVDLNISTIGYIVNNSTFLGEQVTAGIAEQGDLIGMGVALFFTLGLIFSFVFLVWKHGKGLINTLFT